MNKKYLIKETAETSLSMVKQIKKSRKEMIKFLRENISLVDNCYVKDKVNRRYASDLSTEIICNSVMYVIEKM